MRKWLFSLGFLFIFFACSSNVEIELRDDFSGIISMVVNVNGEFEKIRKELLTTLVGGEVANMSLFPVEEIKKYFRNEGEKSGLKLLSIKTQGDSINLVVKFDNLIKTLSGYMEKSNMPVFRIEKRGGKNIIDLDINLENATKNINENKEYISDALAALLPSDEIPMSSKEYKDVLVYFLSDFTSKASELIDNSKLNLTVKTSRNIQEQFGFKQIDSNTLKFEIDMVKGLSLETPIKLRLVY
ncbi:lipoprotein [Borreliella chilensis]|uniref:Lipoprotein n=1 Tax=Borreliella chilensis TaxID=1245910 RepID=A0A0A7UVZ9_9SPIR|nr:lipoprotein [Borreliella chilensis]